MKSEPEERLLDIIYILSFFVSEKRYILPKIKIPGHNKAIGDFVLVRLQGLEPGAH